MIPFCFCLSSTSALFSAFLLPGIVSFYLFFSFCEYAFIIFYSFSTLFVFLFVSFSPALPQPICFPTFRFSSVPIVFPFLCRRASTANTAGHSITHPIKPSTKQQVLADLSATMQTSRPSWRGPACRRCSMQLDVFTKRRRRSKSVWPTTSRDRSQAAGAMHEIFRLLLVPNLKRIQPLRFLSVLLFRTACGIPGCFPGAWSSWHLPVASWQKNLDL